MYTKLCEKCGTPFRAKRLFTRPEKKFCSRECYGHSKEEAPLILTCKTCGREFQKGAGVMREYRKKFGHNQRYCSIECSAKGRRADTEALAFFTCIQCGKHQPMKKYKSGQRQLLFYRHQKFCNARCKGDWQRDQAAERFANGELRKRVKRGYVVIMVPTGVNGKKHEVYEHRYVMEKHIGRPLRHEETVHHKSGQKTDNRLENIELFSSSHGPGQRVVDKIAFAIEMMQLYPSFVREAGFELRAIAPEVHVTPPPDPLH